MATGQFSAAIAIGKDDRIDQDADFNLSFLQTKVRSNTIAPLEKRGFGFLRMKVNFLFSKIVML
jgi:hypothetical protein